MCSLRVKKFSKFSKPTWRETASELKSKGVAKREDVSHSGERGSQSITDIQIYYQMPYFYCDIDLSVNMCNYLLLTFVFLLLWKMMVQAK